MYSRKCVYLRNFIWHSTSNPQCHVTFSKTKMNVNWHVHFILKCHLNFGSHIILEELIFWIIKIQSWFVTKKTINRAQVLEEHVSPNVEDGSPIHWIHFKPTKRDPHKSIKGFQVQPIAQVAFDCILFGKSSLTNSYTWWNEYNLLPKLHNFRPICVLFQIMSTYAPNLKYHFVLTLLSKCFHEVPYTCHLLLRCIETSTISFEPQFNIYDPVTIIAWIITRVEKFGCINSTNTLEHALIILKCMVNGHIFMNSISLSKNINPTYF